MKTEIANEKNSLFAHFLKKYLLWKKHKEIYINGTERYKMDRSPKTYRHFNHILKILLLKLKTTNETGCTE
jgi:hypothetical protein